MDLFLPSVISLLTRGSVTSVLLYWVSFQETLYFLICELIPNAGTRNGCALQYYCRSQTCVCVCVCRLIKNSFGMIQPSRSDS